MKKTRRRKKKRNRLVCLATFDNISEVSSRQMGVSVFVCRVFFSLSAEFFSDFREWDEAIKRYCVVYSNERHILFSFVSFDLLIQFNHRIQVKSTWRFIFYFFPQHLEKRNPHIVCHSIRKRRKFPLYAKYSSSALLNCDVSSERAITGWTEDNATDLCEASNDWLPFSLFSRQLGI